MTRRMVRSAFMSMGLSLLLAVSPALAADCRVALDQVASLAGGPVRTLPIEVSIDPAFSRGQRRDIEDAMAEWNRFAAQALGRALFALHDDARRVAHAAAVAGRDYCAAAAAGRRPEGLVILRIDSHTRWDSVVGAGSEAGGINLKCTVGDGTRQSEQTILIATSDVHPAQIETVALHELGHAIGLHHSCRPGAGTGVYRSCEGLSMQHPYFEAVMYPSLVSASFGFNDRSIKETLRQNDLDRASCLYSGLTLSQILEQAKRDNAAGVR